MPQRKTLPTEEQEKKIVEYCEQHGIKPIIAGRIAWDRLLVSPPKPSEIRKATVPRGNPATLRQNLPE